MQVITDYVLEKVDSSGYRFTYDGFSDYMTIENIIKPDKKKLKLTIENLIKKNPFLVKLNDLKIFLFPYRLRNYENNNWTEQHYVAKAYDNHIVVAGYSANENLESYLFHEISHIFQKRFIPDLNEYKQLRKIPDDWEYDTGYYYHRYGEICAEDIRNLFGTPETQKNMLGMYDEIEPPSYAIKDYILSKVPEYEEIQLQINNKNYSVNGINKITDVPPQIINNRTMLPVRVLAEALNCVVLWNDKTQTVTILK